jgi:hypothetical protein
VSNKKTGKCKHDQPGYWFDCNQGVPPKYDSHVSKWSVLFSCFFMAVFLTFCLYSCGREQMRRDRVVKSDLRGVEK